MATATKKPAEVEAYVNAAFKMIDVKKPEFGGKVKVKELLCPKQTQVREDTDGGESVSLKRCEDFGRAMADGDKFPPVKYMIVEDMPGNKGVPVKVLWDGFHTHGGAEWAKIDSIDAIGWKGTWAQCLAAAAMLANVEHETSGKRLEYADRIRGAQLYINSLKAAGVEKKNWPKSRQLAAMFNVSHTAINDENILDNKREGSKTKAEKLAEKAAQRNGNGVVAAGAAHLGALPSNIKRFDVIRRATNESVGVFEAETTAGALEQLKKKNPGATLTDFVVKELTTTPKPGSEKSVGFDWQRFESDFGGVVRGLDGLGDIYGLKKRSEFTTAKANLNSFIDIMKALKTEVSKPKQKTEEAK